MKAAPSRPRNWLFVKLRSWHGWAGMSALAMLVLLAVTGIYLNHPDLFGLDPAPTDSGRLLSTKTANVAELVPLAKAIEAAREQWGDVPVQFVQLREEGDRLIYRVRRRGSSDEVTLDARTGRLIAIRRQVQETRFSDDGTPEESRVSWTRLMFDLHTGRILGFAGRLIADAAGMFLLTLTASGLYLFVVPRWRRWRKRRNADQPKSTTIKSACPCR
jgi:uncharacterized iron-regulated membrane protein